MRAMINSIIKRFPIIHYVFEYKNIKGEHLNLILNYLNMIFEYQKMSKKVLYRAAMERSGISAGELGR